MNESDPYGDGTYGGIPYEDLPIESIDWTHTREHVEERASRKGTTEFSPTTTEATQAALDPYRLVGPGSKRSIRLIGLSVDAQPRPGEIGRVLKVYLVPKALHLGDWWGATAMEANRGERRLYRLSRGEDH